MIEKTMRPVQDLSDTEIATMAKNYVDKGVVFGGVWPLSDLRLEQSRRSTAQFPPTDLMDVILRVSSAAKDNQISYKEVWTAFRPGEPWQAHNSQKQVTNGLYRLGSHCVDNGLPMLSVLVVPSLSRILTDEAARNIWAFATSLGVEAGPDPRAYAEREATKARSLMEARRERDE